MQFDFEAIRASDAFKLISVIRPSADHKIVSPSSTGITPSTRALQLVQRPTPAGVQNDLGHRIDLGSYVVNEIQICLMGSSGAQGEYVSVGGIRLDGGRGGHGGGDLI